MVADRLRHYAEFATLAAVVGIVGGVALSESGNLSITTEKQPAASADAPNTVPNTTFQVLPTSIPGVVAPTVATTVPSSAEGSIVLQSGLICDANLIRDVVVDDRSLIKGTYSLLKAMDVSRNNGERVLRDKMVAADDVYKFVGEFMDANKLTASQVPNLDNFPPSAQAAAADGGVYQFYSDCYYNGVRVL
jgi:hypothetical protein